MTRLCGACDRPLTKDFHDEGPDLLIPAKRLTKHRYTMRKLRTWTCKMRLIATSPVTGKTLIPGSAQRIKALNQRYVHEARFKGDLSPE